MFRGYKPVKARNTGKRHQPIVAQPFSIRRVQLPTPGYVWCSTHLEPIRIPRMRSTICYACLLCSIISVRAKRVSHTAIASTIRLCSCNELVKSYGMIHWGIIEHIRFSNFRSLFYFTVSMDLIRKYFYLLRVIGNYMIISFSFFQN